MQNCLNPQHLYPRHPAIYVLFRLGTDEEEDEEEKDPEEKKKIWKADAAPKWGHDKFMELDQNPKSK